MGAGLAHTLLNYTLPKLRTIIPEAMDSINPETEHYFRNVKTTCFGYQEGGKAGSDIH